MNHVSKSKTLTLLAAVVLSSAPAFAQSTTRPTFQQPERGGFGERRFGERAGGMGDTGDAGEGRWRGRGGRNLTDEQWDDILKFMREISPERTAAYDGMAAKENQDLVKKLVTARYDYLMNVKRDDPALYDIQIEKTKAEDSIFGVLQKHRISGKAVADEEKKALREQVSKLIDANLKEREMRIQKAQTALNEATTRLDEDKKQKDSLVEDKLNHYLREGAKPLKMDGRDRPERGDRNDSSREPRTKE
jgi:hypothetical protein